MQLARDICHVHKIKVRVKEDFPLQPAHIISAGQDKGESMTPACASLTSDLEGPSSKGSEHWDQVSYDPDSLPSLEWTAFVRLRW